MFQPCLVKVLEMLKLPGCELPSIYRDCLEYVHVRKTPHTHQTHSTLQLGYPIPSIIMFPRKMAITSVFSTAMLDPSDLQSLPRYASDKLRADRDFILKAGSRSGPRSDLGQNVLTGQNVRPRTCQTFVDFVTEWNSWGLTGSLTHIHTVWIRSKWKKQPAVCGMHNDWVRKTQTTSTNHDSAINYSRYIWWLKLPLNDDQFPIKRVINGLV